MNTTTLNMTTLDGGIIIKRGEGGGATINNQDKVVDITENGTTEVIADGGYTGLGKVTINTEVSGGGGELDGEYFLAKPNGRYWKFTFMPEELVGLRIEDFESSQIETMYRVYQILIGIQCVYGAAAASDDTHLTEDQARLDGFYNIGARMYGTFLAISLYMKGYDYSKKDFNNGFLRVWKECDVKSNPNIECNGISLDTWNLVELTKTAARFEGMELTDDEAIMFIEQQFMIIPATEEEYKYWRLEDEE